VEVNVLDRIADGRTDLVFEYLSQGHAATAVDSGGVALINWCAYYGDVSAIRYLLSRGRVADNSRRQPRSRRRGIFHGHWRLCQFLIEHGADVNRGGDTGETPLHAALCKANRPVYDEVVKVLLAKGANPNAPTRASMETDCFMRDCRTKGETPLHRAAAFGSEQAIDLLVRAGARHDAKDMNGDSPLTWASWHLRPDAILRKLCYNGFSIHA